MSKHILVTGGAGFIGSHVANELLAGGHRVRVYDNLLPEVHGEGAARDGGRPRPAALDRQVELVVGDVRDGGLLKRALHGIDAVVHLAAMVGVSRSMYEVARFTEVNNVGTAVLMDLLAERPVERLVLASSMSVYGEGLSRAPGGALVAGEERTPEQLARREWDLRDAAGERLQPVATPETKTPALPSVYALSKYDQERTCLVIGRAYRIPTVVLRLFNTYGPHQGLANPYTGVLAGFAHRLLDGRRPLVSEDGRQRRDFVSVHDVARAFRLALERPHIGGGLEPGAAAGEHAVRAVLNIASGTSRTLAQAAAALAAALGREELAPEITEQYRLGEIRHCFADISRACAVLGYVPRVSFEDGMAELAAHLAERLGSHGARAAQAASVARGLAV